jgi:hypothetical protein
MKPGTLIYAVACTVSVIYVLFANMHGYVPFSPAAAANRSSGGAGGHAGGTAGHFHK